MFIKTLPVYVAAFFHYPPPWLETVKASVQQSGFHAAKLSFVPCANCTDIVRKILNPKFWDREFPILNASSFNFQRYLCIP
jgi:hypothetical protein